MMFDDDDNDYEGLNVEKYNALRYNALGMAQKFGEPRAESRNKDRNETERNQKR